MLTAETITNEQIDALWRAARDADTQDSDAIMHACTRAVNYYGDFTRAQQAEARAQVVEILNKRSCPHDLVEVLSANARNLEGAARKCARCGAEVQP